MKQTDTNCDERFVSIYYSSKHVKFNNDKETLVCIT